MGELRKSKQMSKENKHTDGCQRGGRGRGMGDKGEGEHSHDVIISHSDRRFLDIVWRAYCKTRKGLQFLEPCLLIWECADVGQPQGTHPEGCRGQVGNGRMERAGRGWRAEAML